VRNVLTYHPSKSHPWKRAQNRTTIPNFRGDDAPYKFYAMDADGTVYSFRKQKSRNEWVLTGDNRRVVLQPEASKLGMSNIIKFDADRERVLYDANNKRKWKEKRVNDDG